MKKQAPSKPVDRTPIIAVAALIILGLAGFYTYKVLFEQYQIKPDKIFSEAFSDSPTVITDLTAGGMKSGDYDVWLHFKLGGRSAELIKKSDFKENEQDKELARRWFCEHVVPENPPSMMSDQYNNLKFMQRIDNSTSHLTREWFMYNWKTDDHYYRKWGF